MRQRSTEPKVAGSSPAVRAILLPLPRVTSRRRAFAAGRGALSAARPGRLAGSGMKPPRLWTTMVELRCRAKDPCETHDQPPRSGGAQVVTQQKSPEPIHIGAIYNLTGSQAPLSGPSLDGARLAVDRINAAGGLLGRRVEVLERDGQTDPAVVRYDTQNLAALKVTAIIGLSDTDQVLAAAPVAARAAIPFITSGATSPLLPAQVPDWLFLACFGDNVQAAAGAEYAADWLGARTAAILFDKDMDYTRRLQRYFGQRFSAQGGTVVLRAGFRTGEHDIAKLLAPLGGQSGGEGDGGESAMPLRAQLLFVAAGPDDAGPLVCKLRAGGDSYDSPELISTAEETGGGVYFATHAAFGLAHSTIAMRKFTTWYRSAYGRPPENAFAGLGFDAITWSPRRSCGRSPRTPGRCAMRCWRRAASTASRAACELR